MTYRERRLRRADQLDGWAEANEARGEAAGAQADAILAMIPPGQPILVGHHSERRHRRDLDRVWSGIGKAVELGRKAEDQARSADEIRRQAAAAVYDDDPDAIDRLTDKLDRLTAERDRWTAYNRDCRRAARVGEHGDLSILSERQRAEVASLVTIGRTGPGGSVPNYLTSNLGGVIRNTRQRIERLQREARAAAERPPGTPERACLNRFAGTCRHCGETVGRHEGLAEKIDGEWSVRHNEGDCPA